MFGKDRVLIIIIQRYLGWSRSKMVGEMKIIVSHFSGQEQ